MKNSLGANTLLFPLPTVVVGTYDKEEKANIMTASWTGIINSNPSMLSVSLRKATYSYKNIIERGAFTVSVPSRDHLLSADYVGTKSGKSEDKFAQTGLTARDSMLIDAPYVEEYPLVIECKLVKYEDLGLHTIFYGEILDVKVDDNYVDDNGQPMIERINPVAYAHGNREYYGLGQYLGAANRLWQVTPLNDKWSGAEKKIVEAVTEFYRLLDLGESLSALSAFVDWSSFKMTNAELIIEGKEAFSSWYGDIKHQVFDRNHIIETMKISKNDGDYEVLMDMYFGAKSWTPGNCKSDEIKDRSKIKLVFKAIDGEFKISKYSVSMKGK